VHFDRCKVVAAGIIQVLFAIQAAAGAPVADAGSVEQLPKLALGEVLLVADDVYSASNKNRESHVDDQGQSAQAEELFQRARKACGQGEVDTAMRYAARVLAADPDHHEARQLLGYLSVGDSWGGGYAARRFERGEIWNPRFGWLRAEDLQRWKADERPLGKRWITLEEDTRRHRTIEDGWRLRTDHFEIVTNHSREAAAELAAQVETLYRVWQQLFGDFYLAKSDLLRRLDQKKVSGHRRQPFSVVYYRSRDQYNSALRSQQPRIDITLGIYFDTTRKSHFFAEPQQNPGTLYHEAVHQFFQESGRSAKKVGALGNAWAIEGVACYFESLMNLPREEQSGLGPSGAGRFFTIGTASAGRLPAARHRRLIDDYYVPLAELSPMGTSDLQQREDLAQLYTQSAGLATFFMHYQDGIYRKQFGELLRLLYTGRDTPGKLSELVGVGYPQLDRQYREFMEHLTMPPATHRTSPDGSPSLRANLVN